MDAAGGAGVPTSATKTVAAEEEERYHLHWFPPTVELALCGHGTLASAHLRWEAGLVGIADAVRFRTAAGERTCRREGE